MTLPHRPHFGFCSFSVDFFFFVFEMASFSLLLLSMLLVGCALARIPFSGLASRAGRAAGSVRNGIASARSSASSAYQGLSRQVSQRRNQASQLLQSGRSAAAGALNRGRGLASRLGQRGAAAVSGGLQKGSRALGAATGVARSLGSRASQYASSQVQNVRAGVSQLGQRASQYGQGLKSEFQSGYDSQRRVPPLPQLNVPPLPPVAAEGQQLPQ